MHDITISITVLVLGGIFAYIGGRWIKPLIQSSIDKNYEKKALDKARRIAIIAEDMIKKEKVKRGEKSLGLELVDELIDIFMDVTKLDNKEVAETVLTAKLGDVNGTNKKHKSNKKNT